MSPRRLTAAAALVLAVVLGAACAAPDDAAGGPGASGSPGASEEPTTGADQANGPSDPVGLVGLWRVTDAEGVDPDTWLRLDAGEYHVWAPCGSVSSGWMATDHVFLAAAPSGGTGECALVPLPWLNTAVAYATDGDGWSLLDTAGAVIARLHVDGEPPLHPDTIDDLQRAPEVTDRTREWLATPDPVPEGLTPATGESLLGRWRPVTEYETEPFLDFADDRTWTGSDGCNGLFGAWTLDDDGRVLATAGPQTLMGCDGEPLAHALVTARRAAFDRSDGEVLVLLDGAGEEQARLVRD